MRGTSIRRRASKEQCMGLWDYGIMGLWDYGRLDAPRLAWYALANVREFKEAHT